MSTSDAGPRNPSPAWLHLALLAIAGILIRVALREHYGMTAAFGEDAEFWGYRAVELRNGIFWGTHPPGYPGLVALIAEYRGMTITRAASQVSFVSGVLMAPAMAFAMTPLAGRGAAVLVGWFVLLFPGLLAISLRVEPTGVFVIWVAAILYASSRALRDLSVPWGVVAGLLIAASSTVKENGLLYCSLLVPVVGFAIVRRRWLVAIAPIVPFVLLLTVIDRASTGGPRAPSSKISVPARDLQALLWEGKVPAPLHAKEDSYIALSRPLSMELQNAATTPARRATIYAGMQARRLWRFLGVWLVVAPVAFYGLFRMWRAGRIEAWKVAMILGLSACLAPGFVIIIQARHAEPGAFGILAATAIGLVSLPVRARRVAIPLLLSVFAAQGAWLFRERESIPIDYLTRCARAQQEAAWQIEGWMGANGQLCSPIHWLGFRTGRAVRDCDGEGEDEKPAPRSNLWVVGTPETLFSFENKMIRTVGTTEFSKSWDGICFNPTVVLERVIWN